VPRPTWKVGLVIVGLFVAAVIVAQSCQQSQIRVGKDRAVVTAREQVDYRPTQTNVRLLRQGLDSTPYWAVSLSIPRPDRKGYRVVTTVRVDANTGKVAAVTREKNVR
jgi:hypothetical protein